MRQIQLEAIIDILHKIQPLEKWEKDTPLFESGVIDSITIFEKLLPGLEKVYSIPIEPTELVPENFETPGAIFHYIERKIAEMQ